MNIGVKPMNLEFPAGLRVLVVDDDPTCLRILEKMLKNCLYEVTTSNRAELALKFLRENRNGYDIVISDVHMPDMDGFKLLEHVGLEMDLPVIMMSADDSKNVVMKGVTHGACDYLIKPVRMEALKNIWQHVVRKKRHEWKEKDLEQSVSFEDGERQQKPHEDVDYSSSANEGNWKNSRKRKVEEDEGEERDDSCSLKKPRVVWSVELHQQFVIAVNQLGIDKAVPKKILELMNVPGLTRENVASHLQKYRLYLRRLSGVPYHQNGMCSSSYVGPTDPTFGPINGLDLQALAASGQIPPESLAALGRATTTKSPIIPIMPSQIDQRNIFTFENPNNNNNNKQQVNLLHGIPTNMDSKQLASLHQSAPLNFRSSVGQPAFVDFSRSRPTDFPGNNVIINNNNNNSRMSGPASSKLQDGFVDVNQSRTQDWRPNIQGGLDALIQPGLRVNSSQADNGLRIKTERLPDMGLQNSIFPERYSQEDLMTVLLKQQGVGPGDSEFGFDGYHLDNLPV